MGRFRRDWPAQRILFSQTLCIDLAVGFELFALGHRRVIGCTDHVLQDRDRIARLQLRNGLRQELRIRVVSLVKKVQNVRAALGLTFLLCFKAQGRQSFARQKALADDGHQPTFKTSKRHC